MGLEQTIASMKERLRLELAAFGDEVVQDIRDTISQRYPPPSDAGSPPHQRSGALAAGIVATVEEFVDAAPQVTIESTAPHSRYLEKGTSKMEPRPFLAPAREKWRGIWRERAMKAVRGK